MAQVFISHVEEDEHMAAALAQGLEDAGLSAWYYERDGLPGVSYLLQIAKAIESCEALVVVISKEAVRSEQMTSEIVRGFEQKKAIIPLRWGLSHADFQRSQPEWRGAIGAATSIEIPRDGVRGILPRLLGGLNHLGVSPGADPKPSAPPKPMDPRPPAPPSPTIVPSDSPPRLDSPGPTPTQVDLTAVFDRTSYPPAEDPLVYCLTKLRVMTGADSTGISPESDGPGVDVALVLDVSGSMDKPNRYPLLCEAVRRLVVGLGPEDWLSITLFTDRSKMVFPFMPVEEAASDPEQLIRAMNESGLLFGPSTNLAPGLRLALEGFRSRRSFEGRVRRTYILTDGELHDTADCVAVMNGFRPLSVEVHVYGFGDGFNAAALKQLVSDQIGGTVKPIVDEEDITRTFAHVAEVNRRLIGTHARLEVALSTSVTCGDAWVFQPHGRYLGPIRDHRIEHTIGGLEAGRWYSLLLEVRLPPGQATVGVARASWVAGDERVVRAFEMSAVRADGTATQDSEVRRAYDILQILRAGDDAAAQLASYKARRELAVLENRDPELIRALDKMIASLVDPPAAPKQQEGKTVDSPQQVGDRVLRSALTRWTELVQQRTARDRLTERERLILESDPSTVQDIEKVFPEARLVYALMGHLADSIESGLTIRDTMHKAVLVAKEYVSEEDDVEKVRAILNEFGKAVGAPSVLLSRLRARLLGDGD
jgi:hypothetical protein